MKINRKLLKIILIFVLLSFSIFELFAQSSDFNIRVLDNPASGYINIDLQGIGFGLVTH